MTPEISVVVAVRDGAATLPALLDALLRQTLGPSRFEVLVLDDGSTDGTLDLLRQAARRSAHLLAFHQAPHGAAAARNLGLAWARGGLVAFTDSDCVPDPDWLERIALAFREDAGLVAVEGTTYSRPAPRSPFDHYLVIDRGDLWATCNAAYRRDALLAIGGFDPRFGHGHEDTELALRVRPLGPMRFEPAIRVNHPPVTRPFASVARSHRFWRIDMTLYECQPEAFRNGHGGWGPLHVIAFERGVRLALRELWARRAFLLLRPVAWFSYALALAVSRWRLVLEAPEIMAEYRRIERARRRRSRSNARPGGRRGPDRSRNNDPGPSDRTARGGS